MATPLEKKAAQETKVSGIQDFLSQKLFKDRTLLLLLLLGAAPYVLFVNFLEPVRWIVAVAIIAGIFATVYKIKEVRHAEGHWIVSEAVRNDMGLERPPLSVGLNSVVKKARKV